MFAAHHRLSNLVAVIDMNGQQALGYTRDVLDLSQMADRWRAFGWDAQDVDGHDIQQMVRRWSRSKMMTARRACWSPRRCSAAAFRSWRNNSSWHYLPMSDEQLRWRWRPWRKYSLETFIFLDAGGDRSNGRSDRSTHRRPRLHGARTLRRNVSRSICERWCCGTEHGRYGYRTRRGRLHPVLLLNRTPVPAMYEMIRNGPIAQRLPVRIVGVGGGFEYGHNGVSHYPIEDVGLMRASSPEWLSSPC